MDTATRFLRGLWRMLGSTRLAAILLALLLLASLLASLFSQMPADSAAREAWLAAIALRYGQATGLIRALGLFDVYRAPWFLALLAVLLLNTMACTVQRWPPLWRSLTRSPTVVHPEAFYRGFAHHAEWPVSSLPQGLAAVQETLHVAQHRYRLCVQQNKAAGWAYVYAERGRWSQAATLVSHVAALLLVIAVAARPVLGWQETGVMLLPGQVTPIGHGHRFAVRAGPLAVDRHPNGQPRDYRVPLAVVMDATPVMTQTVRLNHPLTFRGVAFHLQSYGPAARLMAPEGAFDLAFTDNQAQELTLPEADLALRIAYQPEGAALFVEARTLGGDLVGSGTVADGQQVNVEGTPITFTLSRYTVWQVSHDPTFGLALGAAGLLLAAAVVSLWVPHRRLWLRLDDQRVQMVGAGDFDGGFEALVSDMASRVQISKVEEGSSDG